MNPAGEQDFLAQADRYSEGLPELERALGLQPSSTLALNNLGVLYAKKNDYGRALDFWNRSLAIDPRQPAIRVPPGENFEFTAAATLAAVEKSAWRSCSRTCVPGATEGAGRSTIAPFGMRPTVG